MFLSKMPTRVAVALASFSLLVISTYAARVHWSTPPALGIEIALKKPFYIPAATDDKGMSAVVRTPVVDIIPGRELISAVKLVPVMEGNKVKVTVSVVIGDTSNIKTCKDWDSLKSIPIGTYTAGLDDEVSIVKLRDYGVKFESGDLKFRIVPKKTFALSPVMNKPLGSGDCGCASCGTLQCCPNPGFCLGCGECGSACCGKP